MSTSSNLIWKLTDDDANLYFRWTFSISMQISNVTSNDILVQPNDVENSLDSFPVLTVTEAFYWEVLECTWWQALENNIIFFQVHLSERWYLQNPRSRADPPLKISCNCPGICRGDNKYISVTLESWLFGLAGQINVKGKWNIMCPKAKIYNCTQSFLNAQKDGERHWIKTLTQFQNRTMSDKVTNSEMLGAC